MVSGLLDKTSFGSQSNCLIHAIHELYGSTYSEMMLSIFSRLFTHFLQYHGHSCGLDDLILTEDADKARIKTQIEILNSGFKSTCHLADHTLQNENSIKKNIKRFFKNKKYELVIPDEINEIVENKKLNSNHT